MSSNKRTGSAAQGGLQDSIAGLVNVLTTIPFRHKDAETRLQELCATPGFDINALTYGGKPLVAHLAEQGSFVIAEMLLQFGADPAKTLEILAKVKAEGVGREIQCDMVYKCIEALETKSLQESPGPHEAERCLYAQLQKALKLAEQAKNSSVKNIINGKIREMKLEDWAPGGRFASSTAKQKKGGKPARAGKSPDPALHKSKRKSAPGKDANYMLCVRKMQPWELPQRTPTYNHQKPRMHLLA